MNKKFIELMRRFKWNKLYVHSHGDMWSDEQYTLHSYRNPTQLRKAWKAWGVDGTFDGDESPTGALAPPRATPANDTPSDRSQKKSRV